MVQFTDLPPHPRDKYDWPAIVADLKANPGEWGILNEERHISPSAAQQVSHKLKEGMIPGTVRGEFEATTRGSVAYGRYVGDRD